MSNNFAVFITPIHVGKRYKGDPKVVTRRLDAIRESQMQKLEQRQQLQRIEPMQQIEEIT